MKSTALGAGSINETTEYMKKEVKPNSVIKVRLQGTTNDIKWFKKLLKRDNRIEVLQESELFANKGTKKYFRTYLEVTKNRQKNGGR